MPADEQGSRLLHGCLVQRLVHVPEEGTVDRGFGRSIENPVAVQFARCLVSGMKAIRHQRGGQHGDILRQHGIQGFHPVSGRPVLFGSEACDLSAGMHAGVGAAGTDDGDGRLAHLLDGTLKCFLNRRLVRLTLPAGITGPFVFED